MKLKCGLLITLTILAFFSGTAQPSERIFFSTFSPQDWDVYLSKDLGKSFVKVTDHPSLDYDAVISPDGKWMVFTSERSGIPQLYVKSLEGDQPPALLIKSASFQDQATFSPDGKQLAFVASHEGNADIYLLAFVPDTLQDIEKAINLTNHPGGDFRPAFSPDGKQLAFSSDRNHNIVPHPQFPFARQRTGDIYAMDITDKRVRRLTDVPFWDGSPCWSPDGKKILFYSGRTGENALFEMNADGTNQRQLLDFSGPAVSPKWMPDGQVIFTTWKSQEDFKIMKANPTTGECAPLFSKDLNLMFNAEVHPSGWIVFHGGMYPSGEDRPGHFGFDGDVLAKWPDSLSFADRQVNFYGVRRAFVAPPGVGDHWLFYDAKDFQSFFEVLKPLGFGVFWLPILVLVLTFAGFFFAVFHRKRIPFWKYLIFSLVTIISGLITGALFLYVDAIQPQPVHTIRWVMGLATLGLLALAWWQYRRYTKQRANQTEVYRLSRLYSMLFGGLALFAVLCALCINHFVNSTLEFYQVDYSTGEKKSVFTLEKEPDTNPANFSVLDSKVSHDGKSFIFTTGSFRGSAATQGDIWKYDFETKKISKLSDSPYNDGFGDISEDGTMIFRSGRSGFFDIYLQSGETLVNLTQDSYRDNFPAISRRGDKIVFSSDRLRKENEYKSMDIFLMKKNQDTGWTKPEKISTGEGQHAHAHFSPDGEWVIYTTERFGINDEQSLVQPIIFSPQMYGEIEAFHLDSQQRYRLTHNKWEEGTPLWVE